MSKKKNKHHSKPHTGFQRATENQDWIYDNSLLPPGTIVYGDVVHPKRKVRLSQCMIVKNEEKNIRKALEWAQNGVAFEQIVVDTGSTDRTVEIAESMGAKVLHFEWIDDFAAAKNFAMDQCSGDWIAILDADEFFIPEDAIKLTWLLEFIAATTENVGTIEMPWAQLDDEGNIFMMTAQNRLYFNHPEIRYKGQIHESVNFSHTRWFSLKAPDITIMHTGYSSKAYRETAKSARNIELIDHELAKDPNNPEMQVYLADSLLNGGISSENYRRAIELYTTALPNLVGHDEFFIRNAYRHTLVTYFNMANQTGMGLTEEDKPEYVRLAQAAVRAFPNSAMFNYFVGEAMTLVGRNDEAWAAFRKSEDLMDGSNIEDSGDIAQISGVLFRKLAVLAESHFHDDVLTVRYLVQALRDKFKYDDALLARLLWYFAVKDNAQPEAVLQVLGKVYDYTNIRDLVYIARVGFHSYMPKLYDLICEIMPEGEYKQQLLELKNGI